MRRRIATSLVVIGLLGGMLGVGSANFGGEDGAEVPPVPAVACAGLKVANARIAAPDAIKAIFDGACNIV